jgi:hypothetical protein
MVDEKKFEILKEVCPNRCIRHSCSIRMINPEGDSWCVYERCPFVFWINNTEKEA